jgi:SAM-dependent methyltransferase
MNRERRPQTADDPAKLAGVVCAPAFIRRAARWLRARRRAWSSEDDKAYHNALFGRQDFDPFGFHYVGYITIRRFADLVSPYLAGLRTVLDVGCGPAEITCELARRHPGIYFMGVDHSPAGIERARRHARTLGLTNARFEVADAEKYIPEQPFDIITMFDAFHHLAGPDRFVRRMREYSPRFLLLEPRGDWKGSWRRDIDFDWLLPELDKIRARLALLTGEKEPASAAAPAGPSEPSGAAVEYRYALDDFRGFFPGCGLRLRGTVSGLDAYPRGSGLPSPSRERFFRLAYELYADIDELLRTRHLDLHAKHWLIYAEKGLTDEPVTLPQVTPQGIGTPLVRSSFDLEYGAYEGPRQAARGAQIRAPIRVKNLGWKVWSSRSAERPDLASYHWLDRRGGVAVWDGDRTPLPRDVGPGEVCDVLLRVKAPDQPGRYYLAVDLVREGEGWFSDAGIPWLRLPFRIFRR